MTNAGAMLDTYPQKRDGIDRGMLVECIEACFDCERGLVPAA